MLHKTALLLLLSCGLVAGCSKADRSPKAKDAAAQARDIALAPQVAWTLDPEEMTFPESPASGHVHGKPFTPDQVQLQGGALRFRQGKGLLAETEVEIPLGKGILSAASVEGQRFGVDRTKGSKPAVVLTWSEPGSSTRGWASTSNYAVKLEFDRTAGGKIPGRVYLCVDDEAKSYLAGTFWLEMSSVRRPFTGQADASDAPFVRGTITVKGSAKGTITVGYMGQPSTGDWVADAVAYPLAPGTGITSDPFASRVTQFHVSDSSSGVYLCRRLPPGCYFFYAVWNDRGAAWRWVEVNDGGQLAVDFTIDPGRVGALRVKVPPALASETMHVIPLENGRFPSLPFPPQRISHSLKTEARVQAGEASLDRLPAGRYRVLVGDERAKVEIRPGATAQLDMAGVP